MTRNPYSSGYQFRVLGISRCALMTYGEDKLD